MLTQGRQSDQSIMIFNMGEFIKITVDPKPFMPPDLNMILTVTDNPSSNASQCLNKDHFVMHDVTYVIDDEPLTKPQIYLSQQQIRRIQLQDHSLAIIINKLRKNKVC